MRDIFLGLNQANVLKLKAKYVDGKGESNIKTEDLILIRRIQDFLATSKTVQVVVEGEIYGWVHYETIQEDLPMIFPSVKSLKKRIERLKEIGLLVNVKYAVTKEMVSEDGFDSPGNFSVIRLSKECRTLFDFSNMEELKPKIDENSANTIPDEGFTLEGVKGQPLEGVKGYPLEGVNKEYLETNTKKKTTTKGELDSPLEIEKKKHTEERVKEVEEYAAKNNKGDGFIHDALKYNWELKIKTDKQDKALSETGKKVRDFGSNGVDENKTKEIDGQRKDPLYQELIEKKLKQGKSRGRAIVEAGQEYDALKRTAK